MPKPLSRPAAIRKQSAALSRSVRSLAGGLVTLHSQAVREYTPLVEDLLTSESRDSGLIEHTLDGLLDFCGHPRMLLLYRRLCRHYWTIDRHAASAYVRAYHDMWDATSPSAERSQAADLRQINPLAK